MARNEIQRQAPPTNAGADQAVQALVAEFLEEKKRASAAEKSQRRRPLSKHVLASLLGVVCVAAWVTPYLPAASARPVDATVERASARFALFLAAQSVVHFRLNQGRLPRTLREVGIDGSDVKYFPGRDGSFVLQASVRNHTLTYDSNLPAHSILGNAEQLISETGQ